MAEIHFMKGNEAVAEAAIRAGVDGFFFYPLTPSSEIGEYMAVHLEEAGGQFVQAESEISTINMLMGGASIGAKVMTGTSGVGFSLMTEGLSYMAGAELPAVVVDVMRAGPGLGSLEPTQADYNQLKACGHGGHLIPVYAPSNAQEIVDLVGKAFSISQEYRTPVIIAYDGYTGQVMERVSFPPQKKEKNSNDWCFDDTPGRPGRVIRSGYAGCIGPHLKKLGEKYASMRQALPEYEEYRTEDADVILVAFGIVGRVCRSVVDRARKEGYKVGLIRPVTLVPFPREVFRKLRGKGKQLLVVEMSFGQMAADVAVSLGCDDGLHFYRDECCAIPKTAQILEQVKALAKEAYQ